MTLLAYGPCRATLACSPRLVLIAVLILVGCGQQLSGNLRVAEGLDAPLADGTLVLVEVISPLTRDQVLARYRAVDLQAAGIPERDVQDGTAVFVTPFHQQQTTFSPAVGVYALIPSNPASIDAGMSRCTAPGRCSYGGDAVAVRVVRRPPGGEGQPQLYVLDSVVEPRHVQGDCGYLPRQNRMALYCKSLDAKGWGWQDNVYVKRPH